MSSGDEVKENVRILVVDDSQPLRDSVTRMVAEWGGFATQEAEDGAQALEMILADPPDLILLDLEMPRLKGSQVLDTLREKEIDVPVILMTSHGSEVVAVELFRKGVKDYLIKPFSPEELHASVHRALTEVQLRREKESLTQYLASTNQQLKRRVQELDTLYEVGKSVTALLPQEELLERILDAAFHVVGPEEATVMVMDEEGGRLRTAGHRQQVPGELQQSARRSAEELAEDAARKGDLSASGAMLYAPLKVGDRVVGALGLGNRVSGRPFNKHDRQLLLALAGYAAIGIENARLYEEVRRADQAKSEFVSLVAHELRTPMTSIRGYADLLSRGMPGPLNRQQEQFIRSILSNAGRMQVLVSDLQDVSRIETGHLQLELETTRLESALEGALQVTRGQIEARSQQLLLGVPDELPEVRADPDRLTQVLINLLSNAHKYTPDGGRISVKAWPHDGYVYCAVSDTGIGISLADQSRLFTKFFRAENPEVQEKPGTGLGLCITRTLVEMQGGKISVESQVGKGTTFTFTVPCS
jgi:signal transduction histidine kinase